MRKGQEGRDKGQGIGDRALAALLPTEWVEGARAGMQGARYGDNPYVRRGNVAERSLWQAGFLVGREMSEDELEEVVTVEELDDMFAYHPLSKTQQLGVEKIRSAAKALAATILAECPVSADRSAAIRKVREATMTANQSIALEGRF